MTYLFKEKNYKVLEQLVSFEQAEEACRQSKMTLAQLWSNDLWHGAQETIGNTDFILIVLLNYCSIFLARQCLDQCAKSQQSSLQWNQRVSP